MKDKNPNNLPENDSIYIVFQKFNAEELSELNIVPCLWFNTERQANEWLRKNNPGNLSDPIKYTKDF